MKFLIASVGCVLSKEDVIYVEPNALQYAQAKATFEFVFESVNYKIVSSYTSGSFTLNIYEEALDACRKASLQVFEFYKKILLQKYETWLF